MRRSGAIQLRRINLFANVLLFLISVIASGQAAELTSDVAELGAPLKEGWRLTFEDNFNGTELDRTKWSYLPAGPWKTGFRSNEEVFLDGEGHLIIQISERDGKHYFGAITTKDTFQQTYGYYEIRAQLPKEEGLWAAFWLMTDGVHRVGDDGKDGTEVDIFESPFAYQDRISHALHWDGYDEHHKTASHMPTIPGIYEGFHTFGLEWNEDEYVFYVDDRETWRTSAGGVSHVPSWVQVTATTGNWAGDIRNARLPAQYVVDYVRVYERIHGLDLDWPKRGATVAPNEPIRFTVMPDIKVAEVRVTQNDVEIYRGNALPNDLRLTLPLVEAQEDHRVTVSVTDTNGQVLQRATEFEVKRVSLSVPDTEQNRLRGTVHLEAAVGFSPDEQVNYSEVTLHPIRAFEQVDGFVLYEGNDLPDNITLDTLGLADGAYDLTLTVVTNTGRTASDSHRIVVNNWDVMIEEFDPPTVLFGVEFDGLKTSDRSHGWRYKTDEPHAFLGDEQRLISSGERNEYLVWQKPGLRKYSLIVYAQTHAIEDVLDIAVSDDGKRWTTLDYTGEVIDRSDEGWLQIRIAGEVDTDTVAEYLRITLLADGSQESKVQLGRLELGELLSP